jgi:hypothetical protein
LANTRYEYRLKRASGAAQPTVLAGRQILPPAHRGKAILLVDQTVAPSLSAEINTWTQDVQAEGWTVVRHDVPRHNDSTPGNLWHEAGIGRQNYKTNRDAIKALITAAYTPTNEPLHAVVILGHVVVPYSGSAAEDGHMGATTTNQDGTITVPAMTPHNGAWPADAFYGDVDGSWPDGGTNGTIVPTEGLPWLRNVPGDEKFDPDFLQGGSPTGQLEIAVGRIDFSNLTAYKQTNETLAQTEVRLLRQYLTKTHSYRQGGLQFTSTSRFYFYNSAFWNLLPTVRNVARYVDGLDVFNYNRFEDVFAIQQNVLWGIHGGYGSFDYVDGAFGVRHTSARVAAAFSNPRAAFLILSGSYFADWNMPDNIMRVCLARDDVCLGIMWERSTGSGHSGSAGPWLIQRGSLGSTMAEIVLDTLNAPLPAGEPWRSCRATVLLGDPTLIPH